MKYLQGLALFLDGAKPEEGDIRSLLEDGAP